MTTYELKGFLIEELKKESQKPKNEQHPWLNAMGVVPEIATFTYNDKGLNFMAVKELIEKRFIKFKDISKHQGEMMYRYALNEKRE